MVGELIAGDTPLLVAIVLNAGIVAAAFVSGELTHNYSFVDRSWSITPPLFAVVFAVGAVLRAASVAGCVRPVAMAGLLLLWGMRLTWNFARKGGYKPGEQDYRWPVIRQRLIPNPVAFTVFNFFFISLYQNILLMLLAMPIWAVSQPAILNDPSASALTHLDFAMIGLFVAFLIGEAIADNQQFAFQTKKHSL
eukprot:jgi/Hompol1/646/HPOL_000991-RA